MLKGQGIKLNILDDFINLSLLSNIEFCTIIKILIALLITSNFIKNIYT